MCAGMGRKMSKGATLQACAVHSKGVVLAALALKRCVQWNGGCYERSVTAGGEAEELASGAGDGQTMVADLCGPCGMSGVESAGRCRYLSLIAFGTSVRLQEARC